MEDDSPSYINTLSDADHQRFFTGCNFFQRIILEKATNSNSLLRIDQMSNAEPLQKQLEVFCNFKVELYGFAAAPLSHLSSRWRKESEFFISQWWRKLWKSNKNVGEGQVFDIPRWIFHKEVVDPSKSSFFGWNINDFLIEFYKSSGRKDDQTYVLRSEFQRVIIIWAKVSLLEVAVIWPTEIRDVGALQWIKLIMF